MVKNDTNRRAYDTYKFSELQNVDNGIKKPNHSFITSSKFSNLTLGIPMQFEYHKNKNGPKLTNLFYLFFICDVFKRTIFWPLDVSLPSKIPEIQRAETPSG